VDPRPSAPMEALAAAADAPEERALLEEPPLLDRLVAARIAPWELRTPPPPPLAPPLIPIELELELKPPDAAEELDDTVDEEDERELESPPELELDIDAWLLPPPPPRLPPPPPLRPMKAPPPPEKPRLPRSCGPIMVTNFSGPVVPVSRKVRETMPAATGADRTTAVAARRAAKASSAKFF
jgi:hypothetical protein